VAVAIFSFKDALNQSLAFTNIVQFFLMSLLFLVEVLLVEEGTFLGNVAQDVTIKIRIRC